MSVKKKIILLRSYLIARIYDLAMSGTERRCLGPWRGELLAQAEGDLLEIGAGTGANLPHYPPTTRRITLCEPDSQMRRRLQVKSREKPGRAVAIARWPAEKIDLPDASFDTIVSTLVLCSVTSLDNSLREIYRLLRPGGKLLFLEHVISDRPATRVWQHRIEPFWSFCAGDCRLTRDTENAIRSAGLRIRKTDRSATDRSPGFCAQDNPRAGT